MSDPAFHAVIGVAKERDKLLRYSIVPKYFPEYLPVHAIENFLVVYEVYI
jgi:hypothetical protein